MRARQRYLIELLLTIFLFPICCTLMSCSKKMPTTPINYVDTDTISATKQASYLALGDSYTIGQSVGKSERFPHQTAQILREKLIPVLEPDYVATTGWTTQNLLNALENSNLKPTYDIVSLLIGVNNQYQMGDTGTYRIQFEACLQKALYYAGNNKKHVFVLSIPDYSATPFGQNNNPANTSRQIDAFNAINQEITAKMDISYINITEGSRQALTDGSLVAPDGLHPSGKEYRKWAIPLADSIFKALQ